MTGVNLELIAGRARDIRESLVKLRRYAGQADDAFERDERNLYTVMHLLLIAVEAAASICSHLIAKEARRAPGSHAECFESLRDAGIVDADLADRLILMARFRNVLVHRYWNVDRTRVVRYARENAVDLESFLEAVGRHVGRQI
jgi:uncharacterized protein YutE (UPF0331/DUF86 family)